MKAKAVISLIKDLYMLPFVIRTEFHCGNEMKTAYLNEFMNDMPAILESLIA